MTVKRGEPWGEVARPPIGTVLVRSDAEARRVVTAARRAGEPPPPLGLLGGDLSRTLGGPSTEARLRSSEPTVLVAHCDLGAVLVDGRLHWFVAHLVARRSWWRARVFVAMNAQYLGRWDVAPRAHPGDGLLDCYDVERLSFADRLGVRARLPSGTHVPHPAIRERRVAAIQVGFDRPTPVWLDGERVATATNLSIRLEPDTLTCVV